MLGQMVFLLSRFNRGEAMRLAAPMTLLLMLAACDKGSPLQPGNSSFTSSNTAGDDAGPPDGQASSKTADEAGLQPGKYKITTVEFIAGTGMSPESRDEQCISSDDAVRPESFLGRITLAGCTSGEPQVSGDQIRTELQCVDNYVITAVATLRRDGWDQNVVGTGLNGNYEARQTAHRMGDC